MAHTLAQPAAPINTAPAATIGSAQGAAQPAITYRPWLHRFAIAVVIGTFLLIAMGGNVTSRGAGLAVPDGFTVYGHYLWSFPIEKWVGNIFHEHIHRLMGSLVGSMAIIAVLLAWAPRWTIKWPYRFAGGTLQRFTPDASLDRAGVRWLSVAVLALIITQGILGALCVSEMSTTLAIIHGVHAQLFLCLTVLFAAATSRLWIDVANRSIEAGFQAGRFSPGSSENQTSQQLEKSGAKAPGLACDCAWSKMSSLRKASVLLLAVVLSQIILGAAMRHTGAGLAIPDFPSNMGGALPAFNQADIHAYFETHAVGQEGMPVPTVAQVGVHFAHRVGSLAVLVLALWVIALVAKRLGRYSQVTTPALVLLFLLVAQVALGIAIILMGRPPNVATAHQTLGAATFATAFLLLVRVTLIERLAALSPLPVSNDETDAKAIGPLAAPMFMENAKA